LLFCSSLGSVCSRDMMLRLRLLRLLVSDGMWFRYMMQGIWYLWINPSMPWKCFTVGHVASLLAVMPLLFGNKLPQNQEGQSQHRSPLTSYNLYQKKKACGGSVHYIIYQCPTLCSTVWIDSILIFMCSPFIDLYVVCAPRRATVNIVNLFWYKFP
jgi:hypothetical protein